MPRHSLHQLMSATLLVAQGCGLLPLRGVTAANSSSLRFRWYDWRTLYSLALWLVAAGSLAIVWSSEDLSMLNNRLLDAVAPPLVIFPVFLLTSRRWRQFVHRWEAVEDKLFVTARPTHGNRPHRKLKLVFAFYLGFRLGHIAINIAVIIWWITRCVQLESWVDYLDPVFVIRHWEIFNTTPPTRWKFAALLLLEVLSTLQWISCSLVITSLSLILTAEFRAFNRQLESFKVQLMTPRYWLEMRETYNNLSFLTSLLDTLLSPLVLATFILETLNSIILIYWIINYVKDPAGYVLAGFASVKVLLVNSFTQFSVAAVYEESRRSLSVFSQVPTICYSQEVQRLQEQMTSDTVALTGCQFFYVTRSVILTIVSTIVTYEVVLIQFGDYAPQTVTNNSLPSYCHTWVIPAYDSMFRN